MIESALASVQFVWSFKPQLISDEIIILPEIFEKAAISETIVITFTIYVKKIITTACRATFVNEARLW